MKTMKGGCLCGQIRYSAKFESLDGYYCHCRMCQLAFGGTHASFVNLPKKNLLWLKGKPKLFASSKFGKRGFCNKCGTSLTFAYNDSKFMDVSVGSLDHPEQTKPTSHFAAESGIKSWFPKDKLKRISLKTHTTLIARWKKFYGNAKPGVATARKKS